METTTIFELSSGYVLVLAMSTLRITVAYLITPLFTDELVPPLIKSSVFLTLALIVTVIHPPLDVDSFSGLQWVLLFAKEAFIGFVIGFFFGLFLWAFESAGIIIDTQIGASMAMVYDPISGHQVTLYGEFIGRWIHFLFIVSGGLLFLTIAIVESYVVWPLDQMLPSFQRISFSVFTEEFGFLFTLMVMISAPVLVVIFIVDLSLGLINRFAKRLDIIFISMAVKNLAGLLMVFLMVPILAVLLWEQLDLHNQQLPNVLNKLLSPP